MCVAVLLLFVLVNNVLTYVLWFMNPVSHIQLHEDSECHAYSAHVDPDRHEGSDGHQHSCHPEAS